MAGGLLSRLQNQAIVFFTITAKKELNPKTQQGRFKIGVLVLVCMALMYIVTMSGDTGSVGVTDASVSSGFVEDDNSGGDFFDDDGDDEDAKDGGDDDEDDEDEPKEEKQDLGDLQKQMLKSKGPELMKFFEQYRKDADIHKHLSSVAALYSHLDGFISQKKIGQSAEGQPIYVYRVGKGNMDRGILVVGTEHSAEWSSPMSLAYFATRMVQLFSVNADVTQVLEAVRFHVIPVLNVDGYAYTTTKAHDARHWQKNRASTKVKGHKTKGADLYTDWASFSQLETQAVRQYAESLKGHLHGFVSVHCCMGSVVAPTALSCSSSESTNDLKKLGQAITAKMSAEQKGRVAHKFEFVVQKTEKSSKYSPGNAGYATNWANKEHGIQLAFTFEGRPAASTKGLRKSSHLSKSKEKKNVEVPPEEVVESSRDIALGLLAMGEYVSKEFDPSTNECLKQIGGASSSSSAASADDEDSGDDAYGGGGGDDDDDDGASGGGDDDDDEDASPGSDDGEGDEDVGGDDNDDEDGNDMNDDGDDDDDGAGRGSADDEDEGDGGGSYNEASGDDEDEDDSASVASSSDSHEEESASADDGFQGQPTLRNRVSKKDVDLAKKFVKPVGVSVPILPLSELPPEDGSGDYVLYFAYNVDIYYDILLNAGITSATKVINGQLHGYTMEFTYYSKKAWNSGVADIVKHRGKYAVSGVIYRIAKSQLELLDIHNLVRGGHTARMNVVVDDKKGRTYNCMTYHVTRKVAGTDILEKYKRFHPSRQYRNCLIRGARQQHLPTNYIDNRLGVLTPMFSDKIGSMKYRNARIGTICDPAASSTHT